MATATAPCQRCDARIEVICIHCESGTASGDPLTQFTVSNIWAVDDSLACQLRPWPTCRRVTDPDRSADYFADHCSRCGAPQDDMYLHSEPDEPFFDIPRRRRVPSSSAPSPARSDQAAMGISRSNRFYRNRWILSPTIYGTLSGALSR